jgi:signal transduction histidine kinase
LSFKTPSATSIRRRLLLSLLPALLALAVFGAFVDYRVAMLVVRSAGGGRLGDSARAGLGHAILASTWLMGFIQIDVTLLLAWIAVHYGLKPLVAVRREIEARSVRELEPLQVSRVPAEIRPLVDALNLLFEMLREVARSQRQFVASWGTSSS